MSDGRTKDCSRLGAISLVIGLAFAGLSPCVARADPAQEPAPDADAEKPAEKEPFVRLSAEFAAASDIEFKDEDAGFDFRRAGLRVDLPFLAVAYTRFDFDWQGTERPGFANGVAQPWETFHDISINGSYLFKLSERVRLFTGLGVGFTFEDQASNSVSVSPLVAAYWTVSPKWTLQGGLTYAWHPEVTTRFAFLPVIGFLWNQGTPKGFSASVGVPATELRYAFSPRSALALRAGLDDALARLADDSLVSPEGFVEFNRFTLGIYYEHQFARRWSFVVGANHGIDTQVIVYDQDGTELDDDGLKTTFGILLGFRAAF